MQTFYTDMMTLVILPALLALAGYAVRALVALLRDKIGIEIDVAMSASLHAALERYIRGAVVQYTGLVENDGIDLSDLSAPLIRDEIASRAAEYVTQMNPGAVDRFGLVGPEIEALAKTHIDALLRV